MMFVSCQRGIVGDLQNNMKTVIEKQTVSKMRKIIGSLVKSKTDVRQV